MNDEPAMSASESVFRGRYGPDVQQCTANSHQTGDRCGQAAIRGGRVCMWHGGNLPNVKAKANLRLLELVDPAIARLARVMAQGSEGNALKAANSILDRAGIVRRGDIDTAAAQALLLERLREMQENRVVQGEVIDPPDALEP